MDGRLLKRLDNVVRNSGRRKMGFEIDHITEIMYSTDGGKTYQPLPGYLPTVSLETIRNQKYEAVVKYMAITAMYDMMLSDEQVPCKETIAFAKRMRKDLGITLKDIHDVVSNNHFTTQGWINEYYRIQEIIGRILGYL